MVYKSLEDAVEAAKKNDQRAFGFLYDECWDYIYGYVFKISKDERIAEELSLKTLSKAFDKIDKFNTEFKFKSWVITICKNLHIDYIRKQNASNKIELYITERKDLNYNIADEILSPEDELIKNQNINNLLEKIKKLKPTYEKVIKMKYFQEMTYKDISHKTQIPLNTIKVMILRAKKILAELPNLLKKKNLI